MSLSSQSFRRGTISTRHKSAQGSQSAVSATKFIKLSRNFFLNGKLNPDDGSTDLFTTAMMCLIALTGVAVPHARNIELFYTSSLFTRYISWHYTDDFVYLCAKFRCN